MARAALRRDVAALCKQQPQLDEDAVREALQPSHRRRSATFTEDMATVVEFRAVARVAEHLEDVRGVFEKTDPLNATESRTAGDSYFTSAADSPVAASKLHKQPSPEDLKIR